MPGPSTIRGLDAEFAARDSAQISTVDAGLRNGSALQVVPTLTGMSGLPGTDSAVTVYGSGFMNAQTITRSAAEPPGTSTSTRAT